MFFLNDYEAVKILHHQHVADLRQAASGGRPMRPSRHHLLGRWSESRRHRSAR